MKVTLNLEQGLFVIPIIGGYSRLGFEVCKRRSDSLAAELKEPQFNGRADTLEALLQQVEYMGAPDSHPDMINARAAIAKATGGRS